MLSLMDTVGGLDLYEIVEISRQKVFTNGKHWHIGTLFDTHTTMLSITPSQENDCPEAPEHMEAFFKRIALVLQQETGKDRAFTLTIIKKFEAVRGPGGS